MTVKKMREILFDCSKPPKNIEQWKEWLDFLINELSVLIYRPITVVDSFFSPYKEGELSSSGCYDIVMKVDKNLEIYFCGTLIYRHHNI
jgi:hypothetical protein